MRIAVGLVLAALAVGFVGTGVAVSQDDPIAARQALMKKNGAQAGILNGMVKGDTAFDATAAKAALATIAEDMAIFPTLFPDGSDTGDTKAGPAIWSDRAGFEAASAALQQTAASAAESVTTLEELQAVFPQIGGACGACHQQYRS
jgi:cytochrome c556